LRDASAQLSRRSRDFFQSQGNVSDQFQEVIRSAIGKSPFCQRPNAFIRIEFGRIGREVLDVKAGIAPKQTLQGFAFVGPGVIQQHNQGSAEVPQEVAQKGTDLFLSDILVMESEVKAQAVAPWTHRDARNDRHPVPPVAMPKDGGLPAGRPRSHDVGNQAEAGFVDEDDRSAQPPGVFFIRGQSFFFHLEMASSFRSRALRSGF
jgi:hypothetical protein